MASVPHVLSIHTPKMLTMKIHHCNACYTMCFSAEKLFKLLAQKDSSDFDAMCSRQCSTQETCSILIFTITTPRHLNKHVLFLKRNVYIRTFLELTAENCILQLCQIDLQKLAALRSSQLCDHVWWCSILTSHHQKCQQKVPILSCADIP